VIPAAAPETSELIALADDTPETLLEVFAARGWGDGLPLVPPTEARVAAMLDGGDPDEVVGVIPPRAGGERRPRRLRAARLPGARHRRARALPPRGEPAGRAVDHPPPWRRS